MIAKKLRPAILLVAALSACVPAKEFQALQDTNAKCQEERDRLSTENESLGVRNTELSNRNQLLQRNMQRLTADSIAHATNMARTRMELNNLQERYAELQRLQSDVLGGTKHETRKLLHQVQDDQRELQERADALKELERALYQRKMGLDALQDSLSNMANNLALLRKQIEDKNANLIELQRKLNAQDSLMRALKDRVANALFGFDGKGLSVTMKDGKVYVSLDEKLMFKSGRYEIDAKGASALRQLIPVLEQNADINITVEGHTDDVPYRGSGDLIDNWDLSVKRANTIVRLLLDGTKISPKRVTAAGRSQYLPVDNAKTPEARQKNRRTEFILTPNMDELMQLLK